MKKVWIFAVTLALITIGISLIRVCEAFSESKVNWDVSPKLWYAAWKEPHISPTESSSTLMYGAGTSISFKKIGLGLSVLTGDFDFNDKENDTAINRLDTDLYLSYKFFEPYFVLSLGYKFITYKAKVSYLDYWGNPVEVMQDMNVGGLGLGFAGAVPIKDKFYGYYVASILPSMKAKASSSGYSEKCDVSAYNIELGAGYIINDRIALSLGWKNQSFDYDWSNEKTTVSGVTTMAKFSF